MCSIVSHGDFVTPYVGVWIETMKPTYWTYSHRVTPYVGVWIETGAIKAVRISCDVTPYVGVWIETTNSMSM